MSETGTSPAAPAAAPPRNAARMVQVIAAMIICDLMAIAVVLIYRYSQAADSPEATALPAGAAIAPEEDPGGATIGPRRMPARGRGVVDLPMPLSVKRTGHVLPWTENVPPVTKVTLNMDDAEPEAVLRELGRQAGLRFAVEESVPGQVAWNRVTLHLEGQPLVEALLQFGAQSGMALGAGPRTTRLQGEEIAGRALVRPQAFGRTIGVWCTSGPFALVLDRITHEVDIGNPNRPRETLCLYLSFYSEPKLRARCLEIRVTEAVDDQGNSLTGDAARPINVSTDAEAGLLCVPLACPASPGTRIARLRATATVTLPETAALGSPQRASVPVEFVDLPLP